MHTYTIHTYIYIYVCVYCVLGEERNALYMDICKHACIHAFMHKRINIHLQRPTGTSTHALQTHVYAYSFIYIHTYIDTYIYTYKHIYVLERNASTMAGMQCVFLGGNFRMLR